MVFTKESLINNTFNMTDSETLNYISQTYFLTPVLLILIIWVILTLFIALISLKKGWDKFFIIFIIPMVLVLLLFTFTFYIPIIPNLIPNFFNF